MGKSAPEINCNCPQTRRLRCLFFCILK